MLVNNGIRIIWSEIIFLLKCLHLQQRCDELLRENVTSRAREEEIIQSKQTPSLFHSCFIQDRARNDSMKIDQHFQLNRSVDRSHQQHVHHGKLNTVYVIFHSEINMLFLIVRLSVIYKYWSIFPATCN